MIEMEQWADIKGYDGLYQVSNMGRVRSLDRGMYVRQDRYKEARWVQRKGKILKRYKRKDKSRQMVILYNHGVPKNYDTHRLVATAFIPNPNNYPVVNHINHDWNDNRVDNLEWCTYSHNTRHAMAAGRMDHIYKNLKKSRPQKTLGNSAPIF